MQQQRIKISPQAWRMLAIIGIVTRAYTETLTIISIVLALKTEGFWQTVSAAAIIGFSVNWLASKLALWTKAQFDIVDEEKFTVPTHDFVEHGEERNHTKLFKVSEVKS